MSKTVLYCRVSTTDQTTAHQQTQAEAAGYTLDDVVTDHGISGVSTGLKEREGGRRLFDMLRRGDTLVVRWVDRLGRDYQDVSDCLREFMRRGVIVRTIINGMTFDGATKDPIQQAVRDSLIAFMAATAQAQAEASKAAQKAGIAHAREQGNRYLGRKPSYNRAQLDAVQRLLGHATGTSEIARTTGLTRQTVLRIKADPVEAEANLSQWGL